MGIKTPEETITEEPKTPEETKKKEPKKEEKHAAAPFLSKAPAAAPAATPAPTPEDVKADDHITPEARAYRKSSLVASMLGALFMGVSFIICWLEICGNGKK